MKTLSSLTMLLCALLFTSLKGTSQTTENFNSRPGATLSTLRSYLQAKCWQFVDFDPNQGGMTPIAGDGTMVSGPGNVITESTGFYTPVLDVWGNFNLSFTYKFSSNVTHRRWSKIYLTNAANEILSRLDSMELTNSSGSITYTYNKTLPAGSGGFKLYFNYQGDGGDERIGLDDINIGVNTRYSTGCNHAPIAYNDLYYGQMNFTAAGNVLDNDYDPDDESLSAYLITNSPDGIVTMLYNGDFTFTPNAWFRGSSTTFTYQTCDAGFSQLCATAVVTLNFAASTSLPVGITYLEARYNDNAVVLKWNTSAEMNCDRFEIERSDDGITFEKAGTIKGKGTTSLKHSYFFDDEITNKYFKTNDLYYRVRQVDLDGKSTFSKVLIVRVYDSKTLQTVSVSPNPAINNIKVNIQVNSNAFVVMKVTSADGREILRKSVKAERGQNSYSLDGTEHLKQGIYILEVLINSKERMLVKILKS